MKRLMIAAGAAGVLALSSLAALAGEARGAVVSVDETAMTVTLDDGNTYTLPAGLDPDSLQVGEDVTIEYRKNADGKMEATTVKPAS